MKRITFIVTPALKWKISFLDLPIPLSSEYILSA